MRIVVCIRKGLDGEISPFDGAAYEQALRMEGAEVILLSMGPEGDGELLLRLTRLGAARAVLLTDRAFAGADTLATAYALSEAVKRLSPDLVFTGRQTLIGDTGQTGPMMAAMLGYSLATSVLQIEQREGGILAKTREDGEILLKTPALLTFERIFSLRLPRLRSRMGALEIWSAADISADASRIGLVGSPTRVVKSFENESGRRRCQFIARERLGEVIEAALQGPLSIADAAKTEKRLFGKCVFSVTEAPLSFAKTLCDAPVVIFPKDEEELIEAIGEQGPEAVFFGSDARAKRLAASVCARLSLGLCADLTSVEYDGEEIYMYRPALSGSVIAKIKSLTRPVMATVREERAARADIVVAVGYGVKDEVSRVLDFANALGAEMASSRRMTDNAVTPYEWQVGLTGRRIAPKVYIAVGISGAVHHVAGMDRSGTVIAINPDKDAPIFDYADYGILEKF